MLRNIHRETDQSFKMIPTEFERDTNSDFFGIGLLIAVLSTLST